MSAPKIHVWAIKPAVDGTWTLTSGELWAITGFEEHGAAAAWIADYLVEFGRMNAQHAAMMANVKEDRERDRMLSVAPLMEPDPSKKPN